MKLVETTDATDTLAEYAANLQQGPVVVTSHGRPVAVLVAIENADLETVSLSTDPQFLSIIDRSRSRAKREGTISSDELRREFD